MMREWVGRYFVPDVLTKERLDWQRYMLCNICDGENGCSECLCQGANKSYYEEWVKKEREKMHNIPEFKSGDLIKDKEGYWFLAVTDREGYRFDGNSLNLRIHRFLNSIRPVEIYRSSSEPGSIFGVADLIGILEGMMGCKEPFWRAPVTVKEMTMSELKEKLGYEVRIVGEKK